MYIHTNTYCDYNIDSADRGNLRQRIFINFEPFKTSSYAYVVSLIICI